MRQTSLLGLVPIGLVSLLFVLLQDVDFAAYKVRELNLKTSIDTASSYVEKVVEEVAGAAMDAPVYCDKNASHPDCCSEEHCQLVRQSALYSDCCGNLPNPETGKLYPMIVTATLASAPNPTDNGHTGMGLLEPPPGFFDKRPMSFTHIPKTAGTSFKREIKPRKSNQDCYLHMKVDGMMTATFLRSPRAHVQSQFLECKYDEWGINVTQGKDFPRNTETDMEGLHLWVSHFVDVADDQVGTRYDYNCIDPREVQTRHMSCKYGPNPRANHALPVPPNLTLALKNIQEVDYLGMADFYHESMCLLKFRTTGTLPEDCHCRQDKQQDKDKKGSHQHVSHGVPKHTAVFPDNLRDMIDSLTFLDRVLFVAGMQRFLHDIDIAEQVVGYPFLCNQTKAEVLVKEYSL